MHVYKYNMDVSLSTPRSQKLRNKVLLFRAQLRGTRKNNAKRASSYWCAAVYLEDKAFGGHEEGGWWFTCGEPVINYSAPFPIYWCAGQRPKDAIAAMKAWCEEENKDRPSISSVLSEGVYVVHIVRNRQPQHYPSQRPYYS